MPVAERPEVAARDTRAGLVALAESTYVRVRRSPAQPPRQPTRTKARLPRKRRSPRAPYGAPSPSTFSSSSQKRFRVCKSQSSDYMRRDESEPAFGAARDLWLSVLPGTSSRGDRSCDCGRLRAGAHADGRRQEFVLSGACTLSLLSLIHI